MMAISVMLQVVVVLVQLEVKQVAVWAQLVP
jgi:hypothetical protein